MDGYIASANICLRDTDCGGKLWTCVRRFFYSNHIKPFSHIAQYAGYEPNKSGFNAKIPSAA